MANNLFTKEDFIKKKDPQKNRKYKYLYLLLLVIVIAIVIIGVKKMSNNSSLLEEQVVSENSDNEKIVDTMLDVTNIVINDMPITEMDTIVETETCLDFNVEQMAWSVIRGNYGNNPVRRQKLGEDYQVIQDKVNEFYRKGLVH